MAEFTNLHHVSDVLASLLQPLVGTGDQEIVFSGPPLDNPEATEQVRLTLLWVAPQPGHRNDRWEHSATGQLVAPPLTLSAFILVTTYGSDGNHQPVRAHQLLGDVMRIFHEMPELRLPLPMPAVAYGSGALTISQVPATPEVMEKVFVPLQVKHRPWVLFEVGPVQLVNADAVRPGGPRVAPGGIGLELSPITRPRIVRITPSVQGAGGRIRIDGEPGAAAVERVHVGRTVIDAAQLTRLDDGGVLLSIPSGPALGPMPITVVAGGHPSEPTWIEVTPLAAPTLDALATVVVSPSAGLLLTGRGLAAADGVVVWPDAGVATSSEVRMIAPTTVSAGEVRVSAAALAAAAIGPGVHRVAVRLSGQRYTPHILARFA
jgi:hypothetical protein